MDGEYLDLMGKVRILSDNEAASDDFFRLLPHRG